ncbi:hypothetical protein J2W56_003584 [Nocardia kruczakiae]|uniref:DUF3558 domain-containing protein n=1 Tax=Nocardia kruczakiae TaxID=261477 RepID=A0ABU1XH10_9NOCA|nr:DUF3558 family protein [Nocardia kruczakiae]MDR7169840.1 hypothetical protein [Nocardia kruczakiae]
MSTIAGCGHEQGNNTAEPTLAPKIPTVFNPCKDIRPDILLSLKLKPEGKTIPSRLGGPLEQYEGCDYQTQDGFESQRGTDTFIQVTNMGMEYFARNYKPEHEYRTFKIDGRDVATAGSANPSTCVLLIALNDGGVQLGPNAIEGKDPCQALVDVATAIIPSIPQAG